jgi:zinc/manganese transport system substrate-binding protein
MADPAGRLSVPKILLFVLAAALTLTAAGAEPVRIVAAENFYGDVAKQLGGANVSVSSILTNPDQDPHLFEASASTARSIADAWVVIFNGADYDPWMVKLLSASPRSSREVIEVAALVDKKAGDNPHLWYDPNTMPALAKRLTALLAAVDSDHRADYQQRLTRFERTLKPLNEKIAMLRQKYAGVPITATEPVFGYMATAIGVNMRNEDFQLAIMNSSEPSPSQIATFEKDLRTRTVKVLLYNNQASEETTKKMQAIAKDAGVPVVGISETEPPGTTFQEWMLSQLNALEAALGGNQR